MLGNAALSEAPLSAYPVTEPLVFAETDIILRPVPAGMDICLWPPLEIDDCTPVIPPPYIPPGGGGGHLPWNLRWEDPVEPEDDDLEIVQILTYWLNRL